MMRDTAASFGKAEDAQPAETRGWRVIALCCFYALLGAIAAAVSAAIGTFPHWI
jgi:hypothetical protein